MQADGWTWAEPFAGAAACALRVVGGRDLAPPVAWMGGKRRYARAILDAMGVPEEPPSRVLLADAGPWGWVWPLLLEPECARAVAGWLRHWSDEHPRDLWARLAAVPPYEDVSMRAAQWLWLQARSASGVPIWWDGWRHVAGSGERPATDRAEDLRWPGHQAQREAWLASDGRGQPRPAGARAVGGKWSIAKSQGRESTQGAWQKGNKGRGVTRPRVEAPAGLASLAVLGGLDPYRPAGQAGALGGWRLGEEQAKAKRGTRTISEKGTAAGRTGGMVNPGTIADRIEAIARAFAGVATHVHHGDTGGLEASPGWCYLDPPYVGATGYGWDMPRAEVLELARRWADAGAVVAVSEAEPLDLAGWHHLELTREGGKPEWLTLSRPPARRPERQTSFAFPEEPHAG